ncbi:tRNA (adenosine(37)-N6)-threonylcarbamoyltransferase complex ATPase subunit type 1 TsaE [Evansella cellulosilytica]|uniref:tRNA threonylcarbamoyladenosine biosynthesis protein TsaE n=1 Tax=Evansella cellulosilytica (strain ATCC 21833 / DSM 2522 / FERM P-1141 / JCM 9156 / N-4) TaxID=649639 RepID=E6TVT4_EVAC2|nr:tRNA (adenosine(37)-N6)-threonylcarbamoyltransferase complex ATPase subunit type 1 TsaE [Evansella cellulosilytica]ADU28643.1 Uncharacterized protein family UPF0079, ATPase [Evansella cellulosilytica DSM 2522]
MIYEWEMKSSSIEETTQLAEKLATHLAKGDVVTLEGDLGAGKTSFTKGLAKGLGVTRNVNSPTFTIIKEYEGKHMMLYHMDAYRVEEEYEDLGLEEYFEGEGVTVIEWPSMIAEQLPQERLSIHIQYTGETTRNIVITAFGQRYISICKEIFEA